MGDAPKYLGPYQKPYQGDSEKSRGTWIHRHGYTSWAKIAFSVSMDLYVCSGVVVLMFESSEFIRAFSPLMATKEHHERIARILVQVVSKDYEHRQLREFVVEIRNMIATGHAIEHLTELVNAIEIADDLLTSYGGQYGFRNGALSAQVAERGRLRIIQDALTITVEMLVSFLTTKTEDDPAFKIISTEAERLRAQEVALIDRIAALQIAHRMLSKMDSETARDVGEA